LTWHPFFWFTALADLVTHTARARATRQYIFFLAKENFLMSPSHPIHVDIKCVFDLIDEEE
jgi:hypothetical protein